MASPPLPQPARVIRNGEAQAHVDGAAYLQEARARAAAIEAEAVEAAERARAEGYAEGLRRGLAEAGRVTADCAAALDAYLAGLDRELAALAIEMLRRVLDGIDAGEALKLAARANVARLRDQKRLRLIVAPEQAEPLRAALAHQAGGPLVTVEAEPRLGPRQCVLATEAGFLQLGVDEQVAALARSLDEALAPGAEAGER